VASSLHANQTGRTVVRRVTSLATPVTPYWLQLQTPSPSRIKSYRGICTCQNDSHFTSYLTQWSAYSFGQPPEPTHSKHLSRTNVEFWRIGPLSKSKLPLSISRGWMLLNLASVAPHNGDWRLAAGLANRQLRTPDRRRGSTGGYWHAARTDAAVCPPQISLRFGRRHQGSTCHGLQESTW